MHNPKNQMIRVKLIPCLLILLLAGCRVPITSEVSVEQGQPLRDGQFVELNEGMSRETILQNLGEPSWSTPDGKILCYEGILNQGKVIDCAGYVGAGVVVGGVAVAVCYIGPLAFVFEEPVGDSMELICHPGEGLIEEVEDTRRALLYLNERDELETVMLHKGIEDSLRHSRLIQLYDFVMTAQLPRYYLDRDCLSHVYGAEPAWYSGECDVSFFGEINYDHAKLNGVFIQFDEEGRADQLRRRQFRRPRSGSTFERELESLLQEESAFLAAAEVAQL